MSDTQKRFALIAHQEDKKDLVDWASAHEAALSHALIYAAPDTGAAVEGRTGLRIEREVHVRLNGELPVRIRFKESRMGGDQEIGCLLIEGLVDCLIYFWNPLGKEAHEDEIKAVLRESVCYNIPTACNRRTADHLVCGQLLGEACREKEKAGDRPHFAARIALVAHDGKKPEMAEWAQANKETLSRHSLFGTGTTGGLIADRTGLEVARMKSGPRGGDMQISTLISNGLLDYLIFFWDPLTAQPHDVDVKALLRVAVYYNIPVACNRATADNIIGSDLFPG